MRSNIVCFFKTTAASVIAGGATYLVDRQLEAHIPWRSTLGACVLLAIGTSVGLGLTAVLPKRLRIQEFNAQQENLLQAGRRRLGGARQPQPAVPIAD